MSEDKFRNCDGCADQDTPDCEFFDKKTQKTKVPKNKKQELAKEHYPCYCEFSGIVGTYNTKDEFGNIETKYYD